jgi:hypothetical protein
MGWLIWVVVYIAIWIPTYLLVRYVWNYIEKAREGSDDVNLLIQYVMCLHEHGVDSITANEFKLGCKDDETFLRRAAAMDAVFRMKQRVDTMWEGK